jgi:Rrf2 family protein
VKLTRETEYALHALCVLAHRERGAVVSVCEIANAGKLPASFLAKIFQKLARHGLLSSSRGAGKGYALAAPPEAISVLEIVEAIQGTDYLDQCMFWSAHCSRDNPCILHDRWEAVRLQLRGLLEGTSLADLAVTVDESSDPV